MDNHTHILVLTEAPAQLIGLANMPQRDRPLQALAHAPSVVPTGAGLSLSGGIPEIQQR